MHRNYKNLILSLIKSYITMRMKQIFLSFIFLMIGMSLMAQVTTSSMSGRVLDELNEPLIGATIVAVHEPSGTRYGVITNEQGRYHIQGMRSGGPYRVEVSYVGYQPMIYNNITLQLGETYQLNAEMQVSSVSLKEAVIISQKSQEKSGTTTNVSSRQINNLPTINRSISDFTKLSPYAGASNSFAGQDGRYNNITIDGAAFNNSFGLSSNNLPGGDAQPISLDAIEEISVSVSPYDVKVSNFTGGSVNAVTKSGDNNYKGSVYTFQRPKTFTGNFIDDLSVPNANTRSSQMYGVTLSGPILRNKLFLFVNGECENQTLPGIAWRASEDGIGNSAEFISRTTVSDMSMMSNFLKQTYGYDAGAYQDFGDFSSKNWKVLARVDWNIDEANKVTLRFNAVESKNDQQVNNNSAPQPRGDSRYGIYSMAFGNSNYKFRNVVTSITGEWNSAFSSTISNKLLASYTHIRDTRTQKGSDFPFVDIYKDGKQYMSFGTELFTPGNDVENNTFQISNNLNISLDDHYLTAGISFERLFFKNSYLRYPLGYYRYASMEDFMNNAKPTSFGLTYGYGGNDAPGAELAFGMGGIYIQDEWTVTDQFKMTGGLRLDLPFYFNDLPKNNAISELTFVNGQKVDVSKWPKGRVLFSPRFGFNWDIMGDRSILLTGGTGLFTGLLPFVWFTNQPTNSGMLQNTLDPLTNIPDNFTFAANYKELFERYPDLFPQEAAEKAPGAICVVDRDFKMPQVWRSSLGVDFELPLSFKLSLGGMYTRDVHSIVQKNINETEASSTFEGPDHRQYWPKGTNRVNSGVSNAMVLTNGKEKGYQYSFNATLSKRFEYGVSGSFAYTYTAAKDLTANPGSSASSAWSSNVAVNSLNDPGLSYSSFAVPHRLVGNIAYEVGNEKHKTTFSLFYRGSQTGRKSFTYSNDMNGDGNTSDLIYIPNSKEELQFADMKNSDGDVTFSAADQQQAFWNYVEGNSYLSGRKGKYAQRYGYLDPWIHQFDLKITHDWYVNIGSRKYGLQVSLDVLNVGNMFKSTWGTYKKVGLSNYDNIRPLKLASVTSGNVPVYQLNAASVEAFEQGTEWIYNATTSSTWGMQLGFRLTF